MARARAHHRGRLGVVLHINLLGVVRGIRTFLPHMFERGSGYIINTGSVAGLIALTGEGAPYVASKFAIVGLSEALALYAPPQGMSVSVLCPGSVDTNLYETERAIGITPESALAEAASSAVFHSVLMTPDQVGEVVVEAVQQHRPSRSPPDVHHCAARTGYECLPGLVPNQL